MRQMTWKRGSYLAIGLAIAGLIIYTTIAQMACGLECTVSYAWWELAQKWPLGTFLVGIVAGHLCFRSPGSDLIDFEKLKFRPEDFLGESLSPLESPFDMAERANELLKERFQKLGKG